MLTSGATFDAKQIACRELAFIGTEEQAGALSPLLTDDVLAHYALMALARIPGKSVDEALVKELSSAKGRTQIEIMDVLAERRLTSAAPAIAASLTSSDNAVSAGAAAALGKLGDARSVSALRNAYGSAPAAQKVPIAFALLAAADRMRLGGDRGGAASLFELGGPRRAVSRDPRSSIARGGACSRRTGASICA